MRRTRVVTSMVAVVLLGILVTNARSQTKVQGDSLGQSAIGAMPLRLSATDTVESRSEIAEVFGPPLRCDTKGNLYLHEESPTHTGVRKISPRGERLVSERVLDGVALKKVMPDLSCIKDSSQEKGVVTTAVLVDYDGSVKNVWPLSGDAELANCAVSAIKQWRFKPYLINNISVQLESRVALKFSKKRVEVVLGER